MRLITKMGMYDSLLPLVIQSKEKMTVPIILVYLLLSKYIIAGVTLGGVKGFPFLFRGKFNCFTMFCGIPGLWLPCRKFEQKTLKIVVEEGLGLCYTRI